VDSRDGLHEDRKSVPLPEVESQPTCRTCGLVNTELACYVCNCIQIIKGQSGMKAKQKKKKKKKKKKKTKKKKEHKEKLTSKKRVQTEKRTGRRTKTQTPVYLIPSSIVPRSLCKFQTMTPIFRSH